MSEWSPQDWVIFLGAVVTTLLAIVGALTPAALSIIRAVKENTRVTVENTVDRAVKTAATNEVLDTIKSQVQDIHLGTGSGTGPGTTVVVEQPKTEKP